MFEDGQKVICIFKGDMNITKGETYIVKTCYHKHRVDYVIVKDDRGKTVTKYASKFEPYMPKVELPEDLFTL